MTATAESGNEGRRALGGFGTLRIESFSACGLVVALAGFAVSQTPSLIPRSWLFQVLAAGLSIAIGYAIGALAGWSARSVGIRPAWSAQVRRCWRIGFGLLAAVVAVTFTVLGAYWQSRLRSLFGMSEVAAWYALVPVAAVALALLIVLAVRRLRVLARSVATALGLRPGTAASRTIAVLAVAATLALVLSGAVGHVVLAGVRGVSAIADTRDPGVVRPEAMERSGSPRSVVPWELLGVQGRRFVAGGPTAEELSGFADARGIEQVSTPIRVYAGLDSGGSLDDVAALVVDELNRTDAWNRDVLVVVTTTGSGWVDPAMADAVELMFGGDTAIAAMQYTYLPSWASFTFDQDLPPDAGRILFDAVHAEWSRLPEDDRPDLYVFGESIGSYGGQDSFGGLAELTRSVDGALWVGTPHMSRMWRELTAVRDPGSTEAAPVYDGERQVRWSVASGEARDAMESGTTWDRPRVLYVQHPSDVVTWWSPDMIWSRPGWLDEPRGHDVLPELSWLPVVTFWQLTVDLPQATNVAAGHGHKYWLEYIDAWEALAGPVNWTAADRERLYAIMIDRARAEDVIIPDPPPSP